MKSPETYVVCCQFPSDIRSVVIQIAQTNGNVCAVLKVPSRHAMSLDGTQWAVVYQSSEKIDVDVKT